MHSGTQIAKIEVSSFMRIEHLVLVLVFNAFALFPFNLVAQDLQPKTYTWSSKNCISCESTIGPAFFADGSVLFMEGMSGKTAYAGAGISLADNYFVVAAAFAMMGDLTLSVNPQQVVTLETDSEPNMLLFPMSRPDPRIPKNYIAVKKQLKDRALTVKAGTPTGGFLFFAHDENAIHVTVVVKLGNEAFRFPFVRSPKARGKFEYPDRVPAAKNETEIRATAGKNEGIAEQSAPHALDIREMMEAQKRDLSLHPDDVNLKLGWSNLVDMYCQENPNGSYVDLEGGMKPCGGWAKVAFVEMEKLRHELEKWRHDLAELQSKKGQGSGKMEGEGWLGITIKGLNSSWFDMRKIYCDNLPDGVYIDLDGKAQTCKAK